MAEFSIPTQQSLNDLYGADNFFSYQKGYENQQLADQFRQKAMQQADLANQKYTLENDRYGQLTPWEVQAKQGQVGEQNIKNQSAGLDLDAKQSTHEDNKKYLHAKIATALSDEELSQASNHYLQLYQQAKMNGDEANQIKYGGIMDTLTGAAATKAADRVQHRNLKEGDWINSENNARITAEGRMGAAEIRRPIGKPEASWQDKFAKLGNDQQKNIAFSAITTGRNPFTGEELDDAEIKRFQSVYDSATANVDTKAGTVAKGQGATIKVNPDKSVVLQNKEPQTSDSSKSKPGTPDNPIVLK